MTTNFAYADITALKTERADVAIVLRWVQSKLSWYQADPTSSATGDDDIVVQATLGSGRWLKQNSAAIGALQWTSVSASTSCANNTGYYVDASGGAVTMTLPSSPPIGTVVSMVLVSASSGTNFITINRNGRNINGVAQNRRIVAQWSRVDFTFISTGLGWNVSDATSTANSAAVLTNTAGTVINFPYSGTLNAQNDITNYMGTQLNTLSYIDPSFTTGRTQRIAYSVVNSNTSNGYSLNTVHIFTKNVAGDLYFQSANANGVASTYQPPGLLFDFGLVSGVTLRITDIEWATFTTRQNNAPGGFVLYGANTLQSNIFVPPVLGGGASVDGQRIMGYFTDLTYIDYKQNIVNANYSLIASMYRTCWTGINNNAFYRYYYLHPLPQYSGAAIQPTLFINQLYFFGDYSS